MNVLLVRVRFESSAKLYNYLCPFPVEVGAKVVAEAKDSHAVVEVAEVIGVAPQYSTHRWIIADAAKLAADHQATVDKWKQVMELTHRLEERRKVFEETKIWKLLAQNDEEAAAILAELEEVEKNG